MKRITISILSVYLMSFSLISCVSSKGCNENPKFKEAFFHNISIIQQYTWEHQHAVRPTVTMKEAEASMKFIFRYTKTLSDEIYNYSFGYRTYQEFEVD